MAQEEHKIFSASLFLILTPIGFILILFAYLEDSSAGLGAASLGFSLILMTVFYLIFAFFPSVFNSKLDSNTISKSRRPDITADKGEIDFMLSNLRELEPAEFEHTVADLWSEIGWNTKVTSKSNDKGIDVIAKKKNPYPQKVLIQAKKYSKDNKVSSKEIQQYSSLKHQEDNVDEVIVVTTSKFTKNAIELASDLNVKLINGRKLKQMLNNNLAKEEKN